MSFKPRWLIILSYPLFVAVVIGTATLSFYLVGQWYHNALREVVYNAEVGKTETEIVAAYGPPLTDKPGYEPLGDDIEIPAQEGPFRTLTFRSSRGTLWLWLERSDSEWTCFKSCWFADGVRF